LAPPSPPPLTPQQLATLDLDAHLADPGRKQAFVTPMFESIAPRYDDFTRVFSFGMDARWKAELLRWVDDAAPMLCDVLDVACGTGDLAIASASLRPRGRVLGVDVATGMIERARARIDAVERSRIAFEVGDLTRLALPDRSIDVVTGGYALRNVPDHQAALAELARVLRPGGRLFTLDFYRPERAIWRGLFLPYLQLSGSVVGWWWHRAPVMYAYIAHSIRHFVSEKEFTTALRQNGFDVVEVRRHLLGGIALHHAIRR
jgi:demethylmenaquinone methyltransferase / 2-methoxy-6-polyprenyl-1,4-benzoquinol methylase